MLRTSFWENFWNIMGALIVVAKFNIAIVWQIIFWFKAYIYKFSNGFVFENN